MARMIALLAIVVVLLSSPASTRAQGAGTFRLGPGGSAEITFVAYCTEFGKFFPQQIQGPDGALATDPVRGALAYIAANNISADPDAALEANFAIWQLAGFSRATGGGTVTQEVKDNSGTVPASPAGAVSILDAASDGRVTVSVSEWAPIGDKVQILNATDNFYGRGVLQVQNSSTETLTLYMPTGTIFPGSETRFQRMGGYAEQVNVVDARLPSTGAAESTPAAAIALVALALVGTGYLLRRRGAI